MPRTMLPCWPRTLARVSVWRRPSSETRFALNGRSGHRFVPDVVEAFPGEIQAISVSKPALEDVFIHRTGHKFWNEEGEAGSENNKKEDKKKKRR
jgi:hypothetical protein